MVSSHFFSADAKQQHRIAQPSRLNDSSQGGEAPWLLDTLFSNLSYDLEQVADIIDPILTAKNHCYRTDWYIQGIVAADSAFISTNINPGGVIQVTLCSTRWLIGRGSRCAVAMPQPGMADCHAALNFDPLRGFLITDLGSVGGTWVNGRRLAPVQSHSLQDGDLVKLGSLHFEFLQQCCPPPGWDD